MTSSVFPFRFGCSILLLNFQNEPLHNAGFLSSPFFFHNPAATVSVKHVSRSQRACTAHVAAFPRGRLPLLEIEWTFEKAYADLFLLPFLIHISQGPGREGKHQTSVSYQFRGAGTGGLSTGLSLALHWEVSAFQGWSLSPPFESLWSWAKGLPTSTKLGSSSACPGRGCFLPAFRSLTQEGMAVPVIFERFNSRHRNIKTLVKWPFNQTGQDWFDPESNFINLLPWFTYLKIFASRPFFFQNVIKYS